MRRRAARPRNAPGQVGWWGSGGVSGLRTRFIVLSVLGAMLVTALGLRAAHLQLRNEDFYQAQGDARFKRDVKIVTVRGMITDRNGEPLAVSSPVLSLKADPAELLKHPQWLPELASALGMDVEVLKAGLEARREQSYHYLGRRLNPVVVERIIQLGFPGVNSEREFRRFYPSAAVTAQVLGRTNLEDAGQEGLELAYDDWLTGIDGLKRIIRDRRGAIVEDVDLIRPAEPGRELVLSLDRRIQYLAYRELGRALDRHQADAGSMVVLDPGNGEVLAMVSLPSYNPNEPLRGALPIGSKNLAAADTIEPGSVIKAFTVAAALESGRFDTDSVIPTSPGTFPVAGHVVRDVRDFGAVSMTRLLAKSSNIGAAKLALELPSEQVHDVFRRFGFGADSGSGFPGEQAGKLPEPGRWGTLKKVTISYGYGLETTPLQLAQAYAAIANGGELVPPTFIRDVHKPARRVIDPELSVRLVEMLEAVTGREGTGQSAAIRGYRVAGKTGTSRKVGKAGYEKNYLSVFAGFVPATRPRFVAVVVIDNPKSGKYYGGDVAAPVFQSVLEGALRLYRVAPDWLDQLTADALPRPIPDSMASAESVLEEVAPTEAVRLAESPEAQP